MFRCRLKLAVSTERRAFTSPKSCMTRSSWRTSSWPISCVTLILEVSRHDILPLRRNWYSRPSLPVRLRRLGRCLDEITDNVGAKLAMRTVGLPLWYVPVKPLGCKSIITQQNTSVPGTASSRFLAFNSSGETN